MRRACRDSADVVVYATNNPIGPRKPIGPTTLLQPVSLLQFIAAKVHA